MFDKVVIANRGEIALRVARACRELGVRSVALYSTADAESAVVRFADEAVHIGPPHPGKSYLHIPNIIGAAMKTGADAIHPGYGFLSENANFAKVCEASEITFIGPKPEVIEMMGEKDRARREMKVAGLATIPGSDGVVEGEEQLAKEAKRIGYPLILKAAAAVGCAWCAATRNCWQRTRPRGARRSRPLGRRTSIWKNSWNIRAISSSRCWAINRAG